MTMPWLLLVRFETKTSPLLSLCTPNNTENEGSLSVRSSLPFDVYTLTVGGPLMSLMLRI